MVKKIYRKEVHKYSIVLLVLLWQEIICDSKIHANFYIITFYIQVNVNKNNIMDAFFGFAVRVKGKIEEIRGWR